MTVTKFWLSISIIHCEVEKALVCHADPEDQASLGNKGQSGM